jgi:hypothetical protein
VQNLEPSFALLGRDGLGTVGLNERTHPIAECHQKALDFEPRALYFELDRTIRFVPNPARDLVA